MSEPCAHRWEFISVEDLYRCSLCLAQFTRQAYDEMGYHVRWDRLAPETITMLHEAHQLHRFQSAMQPQNDVSALEWWQLCE